MENFPDLCNKNAKGASPETCGFSFVLINLKVSQMFMLFMATNLEFSLFYL